MLKYKKLAYRPWPVTINVQECDETTGEVSEVEHTFIVHFFPFNEMDLEAADAAAKETFPPPADIDEAAESDNRNLPMRLVLARNSLVFQRLVCGWGQDVVGEDGMPLAFSQAALHDLVTGPDGIAISAGLRTAVQQIRFGVAPRKNSKTSPPHGQNASADGEVSTSLPTT